MQVSQTSLMNESQKNLGFVGYISLLKIRRKNVEKTFWRQFKSVLTDQNDKKKVYKKEKTL